MKRTTAALLTALMLLTFIPLVSPSAQAFTASVSVQPTTSATSLKIAWSGLYGATYHVYRSTDLKNWHLIRTTYSTFFTDTSLRPGTRYFYKLAYETQDAFFVQNNWSAGVPMGTTRITSISSPASRKIRLVWSKTPGASGYLVQMATGAYGNYKTVRITSGNLTTFSGVQPGLNLYFRVFPYRRIYGTTYTGISANIGYIMLR